MPTALIVEDEPAANQLLSMLVKLRGYQTDSAFSGAKAIRKGRRSHPPDIVFLDLMLPDINGYEVCKALKGERRTTAIPVVIVTARVADESRVEGFRSGASDYIPKPYTPDQIFAALSHAGTWRGRIDELADSGSLPLDAPRRRLPPPPRLRPPEPPPRPDQPRRRRRPPAWKGSKLLAEIPSSARGSDWGRSHGRDHVADLDFHLDPGQFALTLHDESGWLRDDDPRRNGPRPNSSTRPASTASTSATTPNFVSSATSPGG